MPAINFPNSPTLNDTFTANDLTWHRFSIKMKLVILEAHFKKKLAGHMI
jgi:hypothetical protein